MIPKEKDIILIDYYEKEIALVEEQDYFEMVLYTYDEDKLLLKVFEDEKITEYLVPHKAFDEINKIIKKYKMYKWNDIDGCGIDGKIYVCKFYKNKDLIRVSSENMSEDGVEAFEKIHQKLNEYRMKDYLVR